MVENAYLKGISHPWNNSPAAQRTGYPEERGINLEMARLRDQLITATTSVRDTVFNSGARARLDNGSYFGGRIDSPCKMILPRGADCIHNGVPNVRIL